MISEHLFLASEVTELERLLANVPKKNIIERISLEARLKSVKAKLDALPPQQNTVKTMLTFRGKPVLGSSGITADFGGKVVGVFSDIFAMIAAGLGDGLHDMGPIPNRDKNQLLITGTAVGSFGFEFEFPEAEIPMETMTKIEALFRLAAKGTDDEVTEVIEAVPQRAVNKMYDFLALLVKEQALCGLEFADKKFRYHDLDQLKNSCERLKADNIHEREELCIGEFQGVLLSGRTFEFQRTDQKSLIKGKIDNALADPTMLNREWLHKPVQVKFHVIQVGQGRPRFTLKSLEDVSKMVDPESATE